MEKTFQMVAKTQQGLEQVLASELISLGANDVEIGRRMVSYTGDKSLLYRSNFCLRTALRILVPIRTFTAKNADMVYDYVKSVDWESYMDCQKTFAVDAVIYSEEFRHSMYVSYKVKDAIVDYFREKTGDRPNVRLNRPDVLINIHISGTSCTLSLDSSGESLHRRGYRQMAVEAPLSEVLAAGMILMTGWKGETDFIDPMCGSGTIPIEAALIARNIAPGVFREGYAFQKWKDYDEELFHFIYNDDSQEREFTHRIYAYDNSPKAIEIARQNIKAAGVSKDIELRQQAIQVFEQPVEPAIMVTNPPYGERISSPDLLALYESIGERLKNAFSGSTAWILSYKDECFDQIGLKPTKKIPLLNGELECQFREYEIFKGGYREFRQNGERLSKEPREEKPAEWNHEDHQKEDNARLEQHRRFERSIRGGGDKEQKSWKKDGTGPIGSGMRLRRESRDSDHATGPSNRRTFHKDKDAQSGRPFTKGRNTGRPTVKESYPQRKKRERQEAMRNQKNTDNNQEQP